MMDTDGHTCRNLQTFHKRNLFVSEVNVLNLVTAHIMVLQIFISQPVKCSYCTTTTTSVVLPAARIKAMFPALQCSTSICRVERTKPQNRTWSCWQMLLLSVLMRLIQISNFTIIWVIYIF